MFRGTSKSQKKTRHEDTITDDSVLDKLFSTYTDEDDPDTITMDGISKLCEDLGLDPSSDVRVLGLLWKLGSSSKPGIITKIEFINGMKNLKKNCIKGLIEILPSFDPGFLDRSEFRGKLKLIQF